MIPTLDVTDYDDEEDEEEEDDDEEDDDRDRWRRREADDELVLDECECLPSIIACAYNRAESGLARRERFPFSLFLMAALQPDVSCLNLNVATSK